MATLPEKLIRQLETAVFADSVFCLSLCVNMRLLDVIIKHCSLFLVIFSSWTKNYHSRGYVKTVRVRVLHLVSVRTFSVMNNIIHSSTTANHQIKHSTQIKQAGSLVIEDDHFYFPKPVCAGYALT